MRLLLRFCTIVSASSLLAVSAFASDLVIDYPPGWTSTESVVPHSAGPVSYAVTTHKYKTGDPSSVFDRSLVLQVRPSGEIFSSEFDGKVFDVAYSPSGDHLLVHRVGGYDLTRGETGVHLVDTNGQVVWSRVEKLRMFFFSLTGNVLYAWYPGYMDPKDRGRSVEFFDLSGRSLGTASLDATIVGVVVPDDNETVLFVSLRSVVCLRLGSPITTKWRVDLPSHYPNAWNVRPIDAKLFRVDLERQAAVVVDVNGSLKYTFDSEAIGEPDSELGPRGYASYRMSKGPEPDKITLFNGSSDAQVLDLSTGRLTKMMLDTERPGNEFVIGPRIVGQRLFFFSQHGVRIRSVR